MNGSTPASFCLFSVFSTNIFQNRHQWDSNSDCWSNKQVYWPVVRHHAFFIITLKCNRIHFKNGSSHSVGQINQTLISDFLLQICVSKFWGYNVTDLFQPSSDSMSTYGDGETNAVVVVVSLLFKISGAQK